MESSAGELPEDFLRDLRSWEATLTHDRVDQLMTAALANLPSNSVPPAPLPYGDGVGGTFPSFAAQVAPDHSSSSSSYSVHSPYAYGHAMETSPSYTAVETPDPSSASTSSTPSSGASQEMEVSAAPAAAQKPLNDSRIYLARRYNTECIESAFQGQQLVGIAVNADGQDVTENILGASVIKITWSGAYYKLRFKAKGVGRTEVDKPIAFHFFHNEADAKAGSRPKSVIEHKFVLLLKRSGGDEGDAEGALGSAAGDVTAAGTIPATEDHPSSTATRAELQAWLKAHDAYCELADLLKFYTGKVLYTLARNGDFSTLTKQIPPDDRALSMLLVGFFSALKSAIPRDKRSRPKLASGATSEDDWELEEEEGKQLQGGFRIELVEDLGHNKENNTVYGYPLVSKHVALNSSLAVRLTPSPDTPTEGAKLVAAYRDWTQGGRAVHQSAEVRKSGAVVLALPGATSRLGWRNIHLVFVSATKHISREVVAILVRPTSPKKRALLIGAAYEYPIQLLEGTKMDALRMEAVTRHAFGYGIVNKLTGTAATTQAILDLLRDASAWCKKTPGCTLLVYLSGHGARVKLSDGFDDEGFVPSDVQWRDSSTGQWVPDKRSGYVLTGDVWTPFISEILSRDRTACVMTFFDFCHAGEAHRSPDLRVKTMKNMEFRVRAQGGHATVWLPSRYNDRRYAHFGACEKEQVAHEVSSAKTKDGHAGGALTVALAHTLRETFKNHMARSGSIELTCEAFHFAATNVIRQTWTEDQKPHFEGNRHLLLFDNCVAPPCTEQALLVDEVSDDGKRVHVPAGLVHAMRPGVYNLVSFNAYEGTKATVSVHTVERPFDCDGEVSPLAADDRNPRPTVGDRLVFAAPLPATQRMAMPVCVEGPFSSPAVERMRQLIRQRPRYLMLVDTRPARRIELTLQADKWSCKYIHDGWEPVEFLPACPELHTQVLIEDIAEGVRALSSAALIERPLPERRIRLGSGEDGVVVTLQIRSGDGKTVMSTVTSDKFDWRLRQQPLPQALSWGLDAEGYLNESQQGNLIWCSVENRTNSPVYVAAFWCSADGERSCRGLAGQGESCSPVRLEARSVVACARENGSEVCVPHSAANFYQAFFGDQYVDVLTVIVTSGPVEYEALRAMGVSADYFKARKPLPKVELQPHRGKWSDVLWDVIQIPYAILPIEKGHTS